MGFAVSIVAALLYSVRGILTKVAQKTMPVSMFTGTIRLISAIPIVILAIVLDIPLVPVVTPATVLLFIVLCSAGTLANHYVVKALTAVPIGVYNSVTNIGIAFTLVFSALLLREYPTAPETILIAIVMILCMTIPAQSTDFSEIISNIRKNKGFHYVLLTQGIYSFSAVGFRYWTHVDHFLTIAIYFSLGTGLCGLVWSYLKKQPRPTIQQTFDYRTIVLSLITGAALALSLGSRFYLSTTISDVLLSSSIIFSLILGQILLQERHSKQTYLKIGMLLLAVCLLPVI